MDKERDWDIKNTAPAVGEKPGGAGLPEKRDAEGKYTAGSGGVEQKEKPQSSIFSRKKEDALVEQKSIFGNKKYLDEKNLKGWDFISRIRNARNVQAVGRGRFEPTMVQCSGTLF